METLMLTLLTFILNNQHIVATVIALFFGVLIPLLFNILLD